MRENEGSEVGKMRGEVLEVSLGELGETLNRGNARSGSRSKGKSSERR